MSGPTKTDRRRYWATELETVLAREGRKRRWLADQIGVSPQMVTHVLKGRRPLARTAALRAARALNRSLSELFREEVARPTA